VLLGRGKDFVLANAPVSAATAAAVGVAGITAIAVIDRGPEDRPASAEQSAPGRLLPSFTPSSEPEPDPVTSPNERTSGERRDRTTVEPDRATGTPGILAPTPAAELLDNTGEELVAAGPGARTGRAPGQEPGENTQSGNGEAAGGSQPEAPPKPSTKPSPDPPPGPRADVGVSAGQGSENQGRVRVWARVTGVPRSMEVRLTATASTGALHDSSSACHRSGRGYTCTATHSRSLFGFSANANSRPTVTFTVAAPPGYTDTSPDNNSARVQVSADRHRSG
jgi:hypothetical protein